MSIKETILAEIERRFSEYNRDSNHHIQAAECASILSFIDTLEEEPDNEDLNEEIKSFVAEYGYESSEILLLIATVARHFAKWGAEHLRDTTKMIDKSLEETAAAFVWDVMENDYYGPSELSKRLRPTSKLNDFYEALAEIFIAGAKWQVEHAPLPEDTVLFQKGVEEGKRLMMEEAVEGEVYLYHSYNRDATAILVDIPKENLGDKVRVIIVKEDEK